MTPRSRNLILQLILAGAVCVAIAVLDRPLLGIAAFVTCVVVFAVHTLYRANRQRGTDASDTAVEPAITSASPKIDEEVKQASGCYNPNNPVLPIYYPTERR